MTCGRVIFRVVELEARPPPGGAVHADGTGVESRAGEPEELGILPGRPDRSPSPRTTLIGREDVFRVDVDRPTEEPAGSMRGLARRRRVLIRTLAVLAAVAILIRDHSSRRLALSLIRLPRVSTRAAPAARSRRRCT